MTGRVINPQTANVIVIEDTADTLFLAVDVLKSIVGIPPQNVKSWASGRQIFKAIEERRLIPERVDLILLDIQIPREDGYAVLKQIRVVAGFERVKIIAFTANVEAGAMGRAGAAGFDGFIGKPFRDAVFANQICRILAGEQVWESRSTGDIEKPLLRK